MKIFFICGSIEPAKDGVGDYTRRLCGELIRTGHETQILSLCDGHVGSFFSEIQLVDGIEVLVHRIPSSVSNDQRFIWAQQSLTKFEPDWVSLQFVPYSFNAKGLPFWMPSFIKKIKGNHKWHSMFHELWVGINPTASLKVKCYGFFQKKIIYKLCKSVTFTCVHTSTAIYQDKLLEIEVKSDLLALFGNIPIVETDKNKNKNSVVRFVSFGSLHPEANEVLFLNNLVTFFKSKSIDFQIDFVGNTGAKIEDWVITANALEIKINVLGLKTDTEISEIFSASDYGITTNPTEFITKSGSVASMVEHGLSIISARESQKPNNIKMSLPYLYYNNPNDLSLLLQTKKGTIVSKLAVICKDFVNVLNLNKKSV